MILLVDSVILIDHFNGIQAATDFFSRHQKALAISLITRAEVLSGFKIKRHFALAQLFLQEFTQLPLTAEDVDLAAELRQTTRLKLPDAIQAAIAINNNMKLITRNTKDFDPKKFHFVEIPYRI